MTIFHKTAEYIRLRSKGVKIKSALQVFKNPLCEIDYCLIVFFIATVLLVLTYHFRVEIDSYRSEFSVKHAQERSRRVKSDADKQRYELIIVSMLNGSVMIDNRLKTMCVIDAAGQCQ